MLVVRFFQPREGLLLVASAGISPRNDARINLLLPAETLQFLQRMLRLRLPLETAIHASEQRPVERWTDRMTLTFDISKCFREHSLFFIGSRDKGVASESRIHFPPGNPLLDRTRALSCAA